MNPLASRPTRIRFLIVLVTFCAAFLLYVHRFCFSYAQQFIKEDLSLTNDQFGYCLSAFFYAYAFAQVPSGWFSDRFGARMSLTVYILVWSLFTAMLGAAMGLLMLIGVRMAIGLGQAGAYPTSAALLKRWFPDSSRATASSFVAFGGRLGVGITPVITAYLIVLLVPIEQPAELVKKDLLNVYATSFRLEEAGRAVPSVVNKLGPRQRGQHDVRRRVFESLSPETRETVDRLAKEYQAALAAAKKRSKQKKHSKNENKDLIPISDLPAAAPTDVERILSALNQEIVRPEFYVASEFAEIPMEREARDLCQQAPNELSKQQLLRRNRLLMESVFPQTIRKIYGEGWRPLMVLYGSAGIFVAALFWICFRDWPSRHPWCNSGEVETIRGVPSNVRDRQDEQNPPDESQSEGSSNAVPIVHIIKSRSLWLMCVNQWGGNVGWVFLVTWLPRYLYEVHHAPLVQRGWMAAIPLWCGWVGMLTGGWLSDRIVRRFGLRWRTGTICAGRLLGAAAYLSCLLHPSAWMITIAFAVVAFSADVSNPPSWAYKMDVGGRHVGSIHGWANMWGNLGAAMSPMLLQFVIRDYGWDAAFVTCASAFGLASVAAFFVDARIPIVPEENRE